jgi:hypothetical protein
MSFEISCCFGGFCLFLDYEEGANGLILAFIPEKI